MSPEIEDIKNVPPSPGTSLEPLEIFNPLNETFAFSWDGKPYSIKGKEKKSFPEFLANHLIKHLAMKIVSANFEEEIRVKGQGQLNPDTAKAIPLPRLSKMEEWLLNPVGECPEKTEEIELVCEVCGKRFGERIALAGHMRMHKPKLGRPPIIRE